MRQTSTDEEKAGLITIPRIYKNTKTCFWMKIRKNFELSYLLEVNAEKKGRKEN